MLTPYYKFLDSNSTGGFSSFSWPKDKWVEVEGELKLCTNGFHVATKENLSHWILEHLYEVEVGDEYIATDEKICARRAKLTRKLEGWNLTTQALYATDCAERVIPIIEEVIPKNPLPRKALKLMRDHIRGEEVTALQMHQMRFHLGSLRTTLHTSPAFSPCVSCAASALMHACADYPTRINPRAHLAGMNAREAMFLYSSSDGEARWQSERILDYAYGRIS